MAGGAPGALLVVGAEAAAEVALKLGGGGRAGTSRAAKIKDYKLPRLIISV